MFPAGGAVFVTTTDTGLEAGIAPVTLRLLPITVLALPVSTKSQRKTSQYDQSSSARASQSKATSTTGPQKPNVSSSST